MRARLLPVSIPISTSAPFPLIRRSLDFNDRDSATMFAEHEEFGIIVFAANNRMNRHTALLLTAWAYRIFCRLGALGQLLAVQSQDRIPRPSR